MGAVVRLSIILPVLCGILFAPQLRAETDSQGSSKVSPVGLWKTVDDVTGKVKSVVRIWEEKGKLYGKVQRLIDPDPKDPEPRCSDCNGEQKGRPVVGMRILWNLQKDGEAWSGGSILDPESGKTYRCKLTMEDGGARLKIRGFLGIPLLGRTQYWLRE